MHMKVPCLQHNCEIIIVYYSKCHLSVREVFEKGPRSVQTS